MCTEYPISVAAYKVVDTSSSSTWTDSGGLDISVKDILEDI